MAQIELEKRRGAILQHLCQSKPQTLAVPMLAHSCNALGVPTTQDQVKNAAIWLQGEGLVVLDDVGPLLTVTISKEGREVVRGIRNMLGVMLLDLDL